MVLQKELILMGGSEAGLEDLAGKLNYLSHWEEDGHYAYSTGWQWVIVDKRVFLMR